MNTSVTNSQLLWSCQFVISPYRQNRRVGNTEDKVEKKKIKKKTWICVFFVSMTQSHLLLELFLRFSHLAIWTISALQGSHRALCNINRSDLMMIWSNWIKFLLNVLFLLESNRIEQIHFGNWLSFQFFSGNFIFRWSVSVDIEFILYKICPFPKQNDEMKSIRFSFPSKKKNAMAIEIVLFVPR